MMVDMHQKVWSEELGVWSGCGHQYTFKGGDDDRDVMVVVGSKRHIICHTLWIITYY